MLLNSFSEICHANQGLELHFDPTPFISNQVFVI